MEVFRKTSVDLYRKLAQTVSINSVDVTCYDSTFLWSSVYSNRDLDRNEIVKYRVGGTVVYKDGCAIPSKHHMVSELNNEKMSRKSPCGRFTAILRDVKGKESSQQYLEIWGQSRKIHSVNLKTEDRHDVVHANASFGRLRWSHDSTKLLYVAERKPKKTESFFKKSKKEDDKDCVRGEQFVYKDHWGEQLLSCKAPSLYVYDIGTGEIIDFDDSVPESVSVHDPVWSNDDNHIVFGGFHSEPFRLGFIYCKNRPSSIYSVDIKSKSLVKVAGEGNAECLFSPTFSPDGTKLMYLATKPFGPHVQCSKLMCSSVSTDANKLVFSEPNVLVDLVANPASTDDFAGLYMNCLPKCNWLGTGNGRKLIVGSVHRSNSCILCIDVTTGEVKILENCGGWQVFRVCENKIFACHHTPNYPPVLKCGTLNDSCDSVTWVNLDSPNETFHNISWRILQFQPNLANDSFPSLTYEAVLYTPQNTPPIGLIINPHGGPHSCYVSGFQMESAFWCSLGYAVLRVNYRGSIGFGQDNIFSLPGNVGTQDVCDVQQAAEFAKDILNISDEKVFVTGGSHGGFLTLHLIGQYPTFYAAAATRNPVASLLANLEASDITDWAFCEGGETYTHKSVITSSIATKMLDASPIRYAADVITPTLLLLGEVDVRVPPFQSHEYYRALKSRGVDVKMLNYPDNNHPINKVDAEADSAMNTVLWFYKHST